MAGKYALFADLEQYPVGQHLRFRADEHLRFRAGQYPVGQHLRFRAGQRLAVQHQRFQALPQSRVEKVDWMDQVLVNIIIYMIKHYTSLKPLKNSFKFCVLTMNNWLLCL